MRLVRVLLEFDDSTITTRRIFRRQGQVRKRTVLFRQKWFVHPSFQVPFILLSMYIVSNNRGKQAWLTDLTAYPSIDSMMPDICPRFWVLCDVSNTYPSSPSLIPSLLSQRSPRPCSWSRFFRCSPLLSLIPRDLLMKHYRMIRGYVMLVVLSPLSYEVSTVSLFQGSHLHM